MPSDNDCNKPSAQRFLDERVFTMPAVSMRALEMLGEEILSRLAPETLREPTPLDVLDLVDRGLQEVGIHVYPASAEEIGPREGATDPSGTGDVVILIHEDTWDDLLTGGRRAYRARATVIHEVSHAIVHVPVVRRRMRSPNRDLLLSRVRRGEIRSYTDPEWPVADSNGGRGGPQGNAARPAGRSGEPGP